MDCVECAGSQVPGYTMKARMALQPSVGSAQCKANVYYIRKGSTRTSRDCEVIELFAVLNLIHLLLYNGRAFPTRETIKA